jgi:hypothetical protein
MTKVEVIRESLADVLGIEQHLLQCIENQTRDDRVKKFDNAWGLLQRTRAVLRSHTAGLELHLSNVNAGKPESKLKKAATLITASAVGVYEKLRSHEPVSRNLRDDYASLSLATVSYGMLHTVALATHEFEIATMAVHHLTDLTPLIMEMSDIIPFVLTGELADEAKIEDPTIARQAASLYRQAWSHEVTTGV